MRAAYYEEFEGPVTVKILPDPTPPEDGVVIKVAATGLCLSDWHGWKGHDPDIILPHVPGHELAGVVEAVGKRVNNWKPGDRVTLPFVCGCGGCPQCLSGNHQVCDHQFQPGFTGWGSFAEYVAIRYADVNLVGLPAALDDVTAASLGCRFVTAFRAIAAQGRVGAGQWVAVFGCGGVGLSAIMIANALGARVVAVDITDNKLALARSVGASETVNARSTGNLVEAVRDLSRGGAHVSVDALGSPQTCFDAIASLRKRGKHIQIGILDTEHRHPPIPMDRVIAHELEILGSHGIQAFAYSRLLDMIAAGKLQPEKLIGQVVDLEEGIAQLTVMDRFDHTGVTVINQF
ncbi:alcohol dehydrogenase [Desulfosarcina alkanivorans]|uniref:Alcohol dehydrogenase n=1 Tax=Desulfosarcina alkanivorans TaxID=571177 RepID=A0A5K7YQ91_9BACT|nr:zinc-dependent alcohol dehydrogenase family protein [Desulfosarcina alkanivorans]BBO70495.1 alcohol dehydrogenase [Desulfosarcina alkanivorans]